MASIFSGHLPLFLSIFSLFESIFRETYTPPEQATYLYLVQNVKFRVFVSDFFHIKQVLGHL